MPQIWKQTQKKKVLSGAAGSPNEDVAVETIGTPNDWSRNQELAMGYWNPLKSWTKDDIKGTPKGPTFERRCQAQPK